MDNTLKMVAGFVALVLIGAFAVSFLSSVPKDKYDALAAKCEQDKASSAVQVAAQKDKADFAAQALADCVTEKTAGQQVIASRNAEIAVLREDSDILASARQKTSLRSQYALLLTYYNDGFGPDSVLNTVKMQRIEAQIAAIGDPALVGLFDGIRKCDSLLSCQAAKAKFTGEITGKMSLLANDTVVIVGAGQ